MIHFKKGSLKYLEQLPQDDQRVLDMLVGSGCTQPFVAEK